MANRRLTSGRGAASHHWLSSIALASLLLLLFIRTICSFTTTISSNSQGSHAFSSRTRLFVGRKTMKERCLDIQTSPDNRTCLVDFGNFWRKTHANFTACERPTHSPSFTSKSGSSYWDLGDSVVRFSNHWAGQHGISKIVDCYWTIDIEHDKKEFVCGRCQYVDFLPKRKVKKPSNNKKPRGFGR